MNLEITFENSPWEAYLETLHSGDMVTAARFLALTEEETEETVEEALQTLEEKGITLVLGDLPALPVGGDMALRLQQEKKLAESGKLLEGLEETDPLHLYLEEIAGIPAAGDVNVLSQEYLSGEESVASRLVDCMLHLVVSMAQELTGRGVLLLDLIQEGSLGLWQGLLHYKGGDFESHCGWWIRQYLAKAVVLQARAGGICQKMRRGMEDYLDVDQKLLTELGRNPTLEEIAGQMHVSPEEAAAYEAMVLSAKMKSTLEKESEETPEDEQAVEDTAYFQSRQRIGEMLSGLEETERQLLSLRFGLEGGTPLRPEDVAKKLGLTIPEVIEKEAAALGKLRVQS